MTLSTHIARASRHAQFPAERIVHLVQLLKLTGAAAQSVADAAMLRLLQMRRAA
jgi:hypothetical protein